MKWPRYTWDATIRRYRDTGGRIVPRTAVRQALDETIDSARGSIVDDARKLQLGTINLPEWQIRMEAHLKAIHTASAAAAAGGWAQATAKDWAIAAARLKEQYKFLGAFAWQIENGLALDGRFVNRASSYGTAGSGTYEAVLRRIDLATGRVLRERRIRHSEHPCGPCKAYVALGWQAPGKLPGIGQKCSCHSRCRCSFEREMAPAEKVKAPSKPKPGVKPAPVPKAVPKPLPKPVIIVPAVLKPAPAEKPPPAPKPKPSPLEVEDGPFMAVPISPKPIPAPPLVLALQAPPKPSAPPAPKPAPKHVVVTPPAHTKPAPPPKLMTASPPKLMTASPPKPVAPPKLAPRPPVVVAASPTPPKPIAITKPKAIVFTPKPAPAPAPAPKPKPKPAPEPHDDGPFVVAPISPTPIPPPKLVPALVVVAPTAPPKVVAPKPKTAPAPKPVKPPKLAPMPPKPAPIVVAPPASPKPAPAPKPAQIAAAPEPKVVAPKPPPIPAPAPKPVPVAVPVVVAPASPPKPPVPPAPKLVVPKPAPPPAPKPVPTPAKAVPQPAPPPPPAPPAPAQWSPRPAGDFKRVATEAEQEAWGKRQSERWSLDLTSKERRALKEYSHGEYQSMNAQLRTGRVGKGEEAQETAELVAAATAALQRTHLTESVVAYRGMINAGGLGVRDAEGKAVATADQFRPGDTFTEKGLTSTSLDRKAAEMFSAIFNPNPVLFEIRVPAGMSGAYLNGGGLAVKPEERELLFPPNAEFRVVEHAGRTKTISGQEVPVVVIERTK